MKCKVENKRFSFAVPLGLAFAAVVIPTIAQAQNAYQNSSGWNSAPGLAGAGATPQAGINQANMLPPGVPPNPQPLPGSLEFFKALIGYRIPIGTVFTCTLEDELSSKKSKFGDVFSLVMKDGYINQGKILIPPGTKVIGSVTHVASSREQRNGMPGTIDIALQSVCFPDGRTAPIKALLLRDAGSKPTDPITKKKPDMNIPLKDYAQSVATMGYSVVTNVTRIAGVRYSPGGHARTHAGKDLEIKKGEILAVKLNGEFDLKSLTAAPAVNSNLAPGAVPSDGSPGIAGPAPGDPF